ncbi:MAG TPA: SLC13 family permease [Chthoniobacterales bacterium]|nr:SLC13 family permease [Chthoniobacterales bacterium]
MTYQIALLFAFVAVALVMFATEWVEADVTALGLLIAMVLTGMLPADRAFAGFGSDTVIMILGLLIMTAALMRTGVMDLVGRWIVTHAGDSAQRLQTVVMTGAAGLSAFMSNTAATAFFVPITFGIGKRAKISPSKLLMPLAFATILAGSITLIGTSTNLVVSGLLTQYKLAPMGMFELAPVGIPITLAGLVYMMTLGRRMVPDRFRPEEIGGSAQSMRAYLTEVLVQPDSPLIGKTIAQSGLGRDLDLTALRIVRNKTQSIPARAETVIEDRDVILVQGASEDILKVKDVAGIDIKADVKLADPELEDKDTGIVEMIILPGSPLIGRTLKGQRFREHYGLQVLGVNRHGQMTHRKVSVLPLHLGDVLFVQGPLAKIEEAADDPTFRLLGELSTKRPNTKRAPLAIAIFVGTLALATVEVLSLPVAMMLGALLVLATRCITPNEAYCDVEWKAIILIGSMLALGVAMESTGGAAYLSGLIVNSVGSNPLLLLSGFFFLTVFLTQPMSNQAAAIVVLPIALQTAYHLNLNPRPFGMMIAFAASCSFITPLEPACIMVYGAGRYRFADFLKVGTLLTVIIFVIVIVLVPIVWPLNAPAR